MGISKAYHFLITLYYSQGSSLPFGLIGVGDLGTHGRHYSDYSLRFLPGNPLALGGGTRDPFGGVKHRGHPRGGAHPLGGRRGPNEILSP